MHGFFFFFVDQAIKFYNTMALNICIPGVYQIVENLTKRYETASSFFTYRDLMGAPKGNQGYKAFPFMYIVLLYIKVLLFLSPSSPHNCCDYMISYLSTAANTSKLKLAVTFDDISVRPE